MGWNSWGYKIVVGVIIITLTFSMYLVGDYLNINGSLWGLVLGLFILFAGIVPFALWSAMKFVDVVDKRQWKKTGTYRTILAGMVLVPVLLISASIYNEYRVKSLESVFDFHPEKAQHLQFDLAGDMYVIEDKQALAEWKTFLNQYDVKKMSDREWDADVSNEQHFMISIVLDNHWTGGSVSENRLINFGDMDYYEVVNGPIDMKWVNNFIEKYQQVAKTSGE